MAQRAPRIAGLKKFPQHRPGFLAGTFGVDLVQRLGHLYREGRLRLTVQLLDQPGDRRRGVAPPAEDREDEREGGDRLGQPLRGAAAIINGARSNMR